MALRRETLGSGSIPRAKDPSAIRTVWDRWRDGKLKFALERLPLSMLEEGWPRSDLHRRQRAESDRSRRVSRERPS